LVRFARERSPLYRDAYRDIAENPVQLRHLPVMTRHALMARFDEWATDRDVNRAGIEAFLADRTHIGWRYLDRYIVWTSSGTTGETGTYVQDADALATYDALVAAQLTSPRLMARCAWGSLSRSGRAALIAATGDHFASIASWERVCHANPWLAARGFSVMMPLPQLVAELNDYQPAFLASYPTTLLLLAEELSAGRLRIRPAILWCGGEYLSVASQRELERDFGCPVVNEYGASECLTIAFGCGSGWLHVNADWVLLEAVDAAYEPVAPGEASATVLVTNLANRVQPIIRYDLGDSIIVNPEPCACGSPLPAIRVEGRRDDVLALRNPSHRQVCLPPLALTTVVEEALPGHAYQIVQTGPAELTVRLAIEPVAVRKSAWPAVAEALSGYLRQQSLPNVRLLLDAQGPVADRRSGKIRQVIAAQRFLGKAASRQA
jgi:phenylacetate-coenzyme A ligase PaaK-like adenylate-forming protein